MATSIKNAYIGQPAAESTLLYTCPSNTTARVLSCTATNDTTTAPTLTMHKVPTGESVGDEYLIMNAKTIASKATDFCPEVVGQVLDAGDMIYAEPSIAAQVTISLDVVEIV